MADQIRATPRSPILGLFSDLVNLPLQYMSSPERTQQMQGTADFLYGTGIPKTLERMSYVSPDSRLPYYGFGSLFSGAGGLGGTAKMRPETSEALMTVAPVLPVAGRVAGRMIKATEGLPVGMGIKDVGKSNINVQLNEGSNFLSAKSEFGQVGGTIRQPDRLSDTPYLQINYAEVEKASRGKGKGKELYQALIDEAQTRGLRVFSDSTVEKPAVNVYKSLEKGGYKLNDMTTGSLEDGTVYGAGASKPAFEIISTKSIQAPQQAALDLAQQRAALPVEQGGLGLPANNTPEMRAQAMGFDVNNPLYHATDVDFESIRPSLQGKLGAGVYVSPSSQYAEKYTSLNAAGNARVLPLVARGKLADDEVAMNIAESILSLIHISEPTRQP
jgi:GNAT superfamily N-acetyltransferase